MSLERRVFVMRRMNPGHCFHSGSRCEQKRKLPGIELSLDSAVGSRVFHVYRWTLQSIRESCNFDRDVLVCNG